MSEMGWISQMVGIWGRRLFGPGCEPVAWVMSKKGAPAVRTFPPNITITQEVKFTAARQKLLAENVVNVSTPGYRQKDLSLEKFQGMLRERVERFGRGGR